MKNFLISGLINTETTVHVHQFPIDYYPIDYPFFGVATQVSGVAYNVAKALRALSDQVTLLSMTGQDIPAECIHRALTRAGLPTGHIKPALRETPNSVVLYDDTGRRQIHCDLKDIQERPYPFPDDVCHDADIVAACNINFNRPLLALAKAAGKTIATDVHVLSDIHDGYNQDFIQNADILFLSDEGIGGDWRDFLLALAASCPCRIIVLGRGGQGAAMYLREDHNAVYVLPAARVGEVVNTAGAGDALFSGFLHAYAQGRSPLEALVSGELFAAAKIRHSGSAEGFVSEDELDALWQVCASGVLAGTVRLEA